MKKQRMTYEELCELKPTPENPVELECDDVFFKKCYSKITVISSHMDGGGKIAVINRHGVYDTFYPRALRHYPSKKEEPKYEQLYEAIDLCGNIGVYNSYGQYPIISQQRWSEDAPGHLIGFTVISTRFKLNLETWEIEIEE